MVISEAMASGVCVVTSKQAGAAELITDGVDGVTLDDPGDVSEAIVKLNDLAEDRKRCVEIGLASRRTIEKYTWDYAAEIHNEVYRNFVESSSKNF